MLDFLRLNNNQFIGTIPSSFVELRDLIILYVNNNMLSGTIPALLYQLPKTRYLYFNNNQLTGTIPDFTMESSTVTRILVSDNRLSGRIPESFTNFTQLNKLHLQNTGVYFFWSFPFKPPLRKTKTLACGRVRLGLVTKPSLIFDAHRPTSWIFSGGF